MNVSIGERWEGFVDSVLKAGRYGSASEVVREGLRLVEEREAKLAALRDTLNASIARGGAQSDDDVGANVDAALSAWEKTAKAG
ncbi:MAG: type II toxin-antitoxin system ParD family antitoxin [Sphingorhabdus sp.]|nr:type II toxin-antitoxin system ParD family antitoxin [Sphingorhabdus sp.]